MTVVVSGARPTGRQHLGNYWGALKNWVELQENFQCYFFIADWHSLTTGYEQTAALQEDIREMFLDWLAVGLDPEKSTLFLQSRIPEHAELALLLGMTVPLGWLERNPTYKEQLRELSGREIKTYGFLGYPVLQAADIFLYKAEKVPVGEDQLPHLELAREMARRFAHLYRPVFPEPEALLTPTPKVPGTDARKMSKSYGNAIELAEEEKTLSDKILQMYTDPKKIRAKDKGHPEGCVVFAFHKLYSDYWKRRESECRNGEIGCVACKGDLTRSIEPALRLVREKRRELSGRRNQLEELLEQGCQKARRVARQTLEEVKEAMKLSY
ncbi:MAG: tryptophan--tRNA ligase [Elusimicrobia bacterium]|nr:tryptophan--tRNA ligase [Elusimicrobiota bacterium]